MDPEKALEKLEVLRVNTDDWSDPELADALEAIEQHPDARRELQRRLEFDLRIAAAMSNVDVPPNLRDRLLTAVANEGLPTDQPGAPHPAPTPVAHRAVARRLLLATTAIALLATLGVWLWGRGSTIEYSTLVRSAPRNPADVLQQARASETSAAPVTNVPVWLQRKTGVVRTGWSNSGVTSLVVASRHWVLIVTPRERVAAKPDFHAGGTFGGQDGQYAYRAWQDEQFVYVLFVRGQKREADRVWLREFSNAVS